ncbi:hypothetical protein F441_01287, partial [Phytophthora nicotianae CJ01A1]
VIARSATDSLRESRRAPAAPPAPSTSRRTRPTKTTPRPRLQRAIRGLPALCPNKKLHTTAQRPSDDMAAKNCMAMTDRTV